jgi:uncharacterized phiE125 gp8 family phage protein
MDYALTLVTPPATEPVSLPEAKAHLRVDGTDEDTLINTLITAAREYCEQIQGRSYITQTWELTLDAWPAEPEIRLPRPPLQSVAWVQYRDQSGIEYTLDPPAYVVDSRSEPGRIVLASGQSWPPVTLYPAGAITVRFTAGYGDAAAVPQRVRQAILLLVGHWYANREAVLIGSISKEIEMSVHALLSLDRVW